MTNLEALGHQIKEKLAASEKRWRLQQDHLGQRMIEFEARHRAFTAIADRLVEGIIRPRLRKLAEYFDKAALAEPDPQGRHTSVCRFAHTTRFPATTKLELAVSRDSPCETFLVLYSLEILPVYFQFENRDQLAFPLGRVDEAKVAAWVDQKILGFVETYLRLESCDQYQTDNLVIDPVCGMRVNKEYAAARVKYRGQNFYFCVEACKDRFLEDPAAFLDTAEPVPR
jgi:YHS domain-containing protein